MRAHAEIVAEQRTLWSTAPRDWAELAEPENAPLYERMLEVAGVGAGISLLDVACGSGLLCKMAAARGARVSGIDITPELLGIARERTRGTDFREGDLAELPFADAGFDVVTGANAFQFAPDPAVAFGEATRVLRPGGLLVAATFAEPERNDGTVLHLAMKTLVEEVEGREDGYAPYALSQPGGLEHALGVAGLRVREAGEVLLDWRYADHHTTLRALLCSAGGARAARVAGRDRVAAALTSAMLQFTGPDGVVTMHNVFRYVVAQRPE